MLHEFVCLRYLGSCIYGICAYGLKFTVWNMLSCRPGLDGNGSVDYRGSEQGFWNQAAWVESQIFKTLTVLI